MRVTSSQKVWVNQGSSSLRKDSVIKCPTALQGHSSQGRVVSQGGSRCPSLGSYSVTRSLAHEDKGQSWPGGHSLQLKSGKGLLWFKALRGHSQLEWGPAKRGVTVGQRSQPIRSSQGDHSLEALRPVVQKPLPSLPAHLTASAALHTSLPCCWDKAPNPFSLTSGRKQQAKLHILAESRRP